MKKRTIGLLCMTAGILSVVQVQAGESRWECERYMDEEGNFVCDFEEAEVKLPADWSGKFGVKTYSDRVDFYHKASRKAIRDAGWTDFGGRLFSICFSEDTEFAEYLPAFDIIGDGADGTYYLEYPTDVQGYQKDEEIFDEWMKMAEDLEWVTYHAVMRNFAGNVTGSADCGDYIIPDSNKRFLDEADIAGMNVGKMQMAINEIYARHGRKFQLKDINAYFLSKSWYKGKVSADAFDESVFNEYESSNVTLLQECIADPPVGVYPPLEPDMDVEAEFGETA